MSTSTASTIDLDAVKRRQQATWASGDYSAVATLIVPVAERLLDLADVRAGARVLDVATGSGNAAIAAARFGCDVTGTDYVESLLERARERAEAERLPVDFALGDAEDIEYATGSFDAVVSVFGSMFAPDHRRTAAEMLRVTRPDGTVALASWTPDGFIGELFRTVAGFAPPPAGPRIADALGHADAPGGDLRPRRELEPRDGDLHVPLPVGRGVRRVLHRLLRPDAEGRRGSRRARRGARVGDRRARPPLEQARRRRPRRGPVGLPRLGGGSTMMRPLGVTTYLARERVERFRHEAEAARLAAEARRAKRASRLDPPPESAVTIRLDRAGDASRLYQLAALSGERLAPGPFVVAEVDGRVVCATPAAGGPTVCDSRERGRVREALAQFRSIWLPPRIASRPSE